MANPVIATPNSDLPAPTLVNTLNGSALPTLHNSLVDDEELVNGEEVAD